MARIIDGKWCNCPECRGLDRHDYSDEEIGFMATKALNSIVDALKGAKVQNPKKTKLLAPVVRGWIEGVEYQAVIILSPRKADFVKPDCIKYEE